MADVALTEPSPAPQPTIPPVEAKLRGVLGAMTEAVDAILGTTEIDRFGRAARLCVMGQKISGELVKTIKEAKKVRALDNRGAAINGLMGPEAQYIGQGGGDIDGYAEDMADHDILQGGAGEIAMPRMMGGGNDAIQLQRDMTMVVQEWFADQKKAKAEKAAKPPTRLDTYGELHQAFTAISLLKLNDPESPHLAVLNKQVNALMAKIAEGDEKDDAAAPDTTHVVPTELLRGHPSGAGEQWGDAADPRRPVLHREDRGEGADRGGEAQRDLEEAVG